MAWRANYTEVVNGLIDSRVPQGWHRKIYLNAALGDDSAVNDGADPNTPIASLTEADNFLRAGYNDAIILQPSTSSISLAASYTWSKNMCGLIGNSPEAFMNQRARIGMSTTFTPMITVSGYGNLFANLYTMHGTAVGDLVGWLISGHRNSFQNVHFGGPMEAAQGGASGYIGVHVTGTENYFKNCTLGTSTIGRDEVTPNVKLGPGTRTVFENCIFQCYLTDGDPVFITADNSSGTTEAWFKNCQFIALNANWATAMTVALTATAGGSTCGLYFDNNCQFVNVTATCANDVDQFVWLPRQFTTTTDTEGMRSVQLSI